MCDQSIYQKAHKPPGDVCEPMYRKAVLADAPVIVALVNSAYRGDTSRLGWTTEADILGGQRTDAEEIAQLIAEAESELLLCLQEGEIVGSVHLHREDVRTAYLGMLVIKPGLQGQGLGTRLMDEAERFLREEWGQTCCVCRSSPCVPS